MDIAPIIMTIDSLYKSFEGINAVDNLSFNLKKGIITAIIGPNGAGKTTLFNLLTGFIPSDSGRIKYENTNISRFSPDKIARLGVGRTFQNVRLFNQMTVLDNVLFAMKYEKSNSLVAALLKTKAMQIEEDNNYEKAIEYLKIVDMVHKVNSLAQDLSYGQRKLVEIARTLALEPELLLLDEPAAGLHSEIIVKVKEVMKTLCGRGITICFIEHNMKVVMDMADQIIVLDQGKLIAQGIPQDVKNNQDVINAYLGRKN